MFRIAFIPTQNSGVVYWRMWNFAQALRKFPGVEVAFYCWQAENVNLHPWTQDCYSNKKIKYEIDNLVKTADVTVTQMANTPLSLSILEATRRLNKKPVLMETDDYIYNVPRYNPASRAYFPDSDLEHYALTQMKGMDGLIVTTPFLKEAYSQFNDNVTVIPNSIDFKLWDNKLKKHNDTRIGWIGGGTHADDLEMVWPAVEEVLNKNPDTNFYCVHGVPDFLKNNKRVKWTHEWVYILKYPKYMASFGFDIGIAPLTECAFNKAKSNIRWLEYSVYKTPSVSSDIGHFKDTIKHGKTGFLAATQGDWIEYLDKLVKDINLRKKMGEAAYKEIQKNFRVEDTAKKYLETLKAAKYREERNATVGTA